MSKPATVLKNPMLQKMEPYIFECLLSNPAAASGDVPKYTPQFGYPILAGKSATEFTQAIVDAFLGTTSEFAVTTAFGSTAMGVDVIGFVLNMGGQAASALWVEAQLYIGTAAANATAAKEGNGTVTTVLPDTLTQGLAVTTGGNVYGRVILTGADANAVPVLLRVAVLLK